VAKVFGGATIFSVTGTSSIGASNTAAAIELLQAERISVLSQRTGGTQGIVLYFTTSNGAAYLRRITGYDSTGMQV
jgi:chemotaxis receptor (MCP) glutamine deamidase CheD